jgi:lipopolysaccharide transport system ATP-binding protein/teichoic acid transport system ATP-binding protein
LPSASELPVVSVSDVSITYRTSFEKRPTLRDAVVRLGRGQKTVREVEAVKHVSFDVAQGTVMGIVGSNGAGKSTLVRAIAGILPPTTGRIEVRGKVSTLLALGVGFNPSMSGQENVLLGGLAAGYTRDEIAQRYEEIADFAELGDFMEMPMKTYSSGMFSRLAFAVAVHMEPDILLVDEALSAGDAKFKEKAAAKMQSLVAEARTMFLVSHALGTVTEMCNDAIWLNKGELMLRGEPADVVKEYTRFVKVGESAYTLEDM